MFDIALKSAGASISETTSSDPNYPPENILDGTAETFWTSTGLFPQHFVISFASQMRVESVQFQCSNVKELSVDRSVQNISNDFERIQEKKLEHSSGHMQNEEFLLDNTTAQHLRFTINSAHDHFVAVFKVSVNGHALHG